MGTPVNLNSVDSASGTTTGESTMTLGHYHYTLFVVARNLDAAGDTLKVDLEGSPDEEHWADAASVSAGDFSEDATSGDFTAIVNFEGFLPYVRARVESFGDDAGGDLSVDAYVTASAWPEAGVRAGRENPQ